MQFEVEFLELIHLLLENYKKNKTYLSELENQYASLINNNKKLFNINSLFKKAYGINQSNQYDRIVLEVAGYDENPIVALFYKCVALRKNINSIVRERNVVATRNNILTQENDILYDIGMKSKYAKNDDQEKAAQELIAANIKLDDQQKNKILDMLRGVDKTPIDIGKSKVPSEKVCNDELIVALQNQEAALRVGDDAAAEKIREKKLKCYLKLLLAKLQESIGTIEQNTGKFINANLTEYEIIGWENTDKYKGDANVDAFLKGELAYFGDNPDMNFFDKPKKDQKRYDAFVVYINRIRDDIIRERSQAIINDKVVVDENSKKLDNLIQNQLARLNYGLDDVLKLSLAQFVPGLTYEIKPTVEKTDEEVQQMIIKFRSQCNDDIIKRKKQDPTKECEVPDSDAGILVNFIDAIKDSRTKAAKALAGKVLAKQYVKHLHDSVVKFREDLEGQSELYKFGVKSSYTDKLTYDDDEGDKINDDEIQNKINEYLNEYVETNIEKIFSNGLDIVNVDATYKTENTFNTKFFNAVIENRKKAIEKDSGEANENSTTKLNKLIEDQLNILNKGIDNNLKLTLDKSQNLSYDIKVIGVKTDEEIRQMIINFKNQCAQDIIERKKNDPNAECTTENKQSLVKFIEAVKESRDKAIKDNEGKLKAEANIVSLQQLIENKTKELDYQGYVFGDNKSKHLMYAKTIDADFKTTINNLKAKYDIKNINILFTDLALDKVNATYKQYVNEINDIFDDVIDLRQSAVKEDIKRAQEEHDEALPDLIEEQLNELNKGLDPVFHLKQDGDTFKGITGLKYLVEGNEQEDTQVADMIKRFNDKCKIDLISREKQTAANCGVPPPVANVLSVFINDIKPKRDAAINAIATELQNLVDTELQKLKDDYKDFGTDIGIKHNINNNDTTEADFIKSSIPILRNNMKIILANEMKNANITEAINKIKQQIMKTFTDVKQKHTDESIKHYINMLKQNCMDLNKPTLDTKIRNEITSYCTKNITDDNFKTQSGNKHDFSTTYQNLRTKIGNDVTAIITEHADKQEAHKKKIDQIFENLKEYYKQQTSENKLDFNGIVYKYPEQEWSLTTGKVIESDVDIKIKDEILNDSIKIQKYNEVFDDKYEENQKAEINRRLKDIINIRKMYLPRSMTITLFYVPIAQEKIKIVSAIPELNGPLNRVANEYKWQGTFNVPVGRHKYNFNNDTILSNELELLVSPNYPPSMSVDAYWIDPNYIDQLKNIIAKKCDDKINQLVTPKLTSWLNDVKTELPLKQNVESGIKSIRDKCIAWDPNMKGNSAPANIYQEYIRLENLLNSAVYDKDVEELDKLKPKPKEPTPQVNPNLDTPEKLKTALEAAKPDGFGPQLGSMYLKAINGIATKLINIMKDDKIGDKKQALETQIKATPNIQALGKFVHAAIYNVNPQNATEFGNLLKDIPYLNINMVGGNKNDYDDKHYIKYMKYKTKYLVKTGKNDAIIKKMLFRK